MPLSIRVAKCKRVAAVMRWLALIVAGLSLACLLVFADDSGAPRKKIVRRVLGWDSMRFPLCYSSVVRFRALESYVQPKDRLNFSISF